MQKRQQDFFVLVKKLAIKAVNELLGTGIGWAAGLLASDLVAYFFVKKSLLNIWGVFAFKREAVDKDLYGKLEWAMAALIGFLVLSLVNRFVGQPLKARFIEASASKKPRKRKGRPGVKTK